MYWMYWGEGAIRVASSPDLIHWTPVQDQSAEPVELLRPRPGHFDSSFPETGPPPVLTSAGIVVLYNGKNAPSDGDPALGPNAYAAGEALFNAINPMHLLTQTRGPVLKPELPYEKTGQYTAGTTFAEGLVWFHKEWFLYYGCADSLVAVATAPAAPTAEPAPLAAADPVSPPVSQEVRRPAAGDFYLHDGDTVVFYGDSITEQNLYNQVVELYTATRFPSMRVRFFGAGVGGDRVTGGGGGPVDQRLERDVFSEKPSVVTVMLGMNDGRYRATTDEIESAYLKGYEHLLDSLRTNAPSARVTLLGPSPYDDVTRAPFFAGGYNAVMQHFGVLDRALAQKYGAQFVDLNPGVVTALQKAEALDPRIAQLMLPDRVHPEWLAHWVMAEQLLSGWNAPAVVSAVTIDARAASATQQDNAKVDHLETNPGSVRWTATENALPLPLARSHAAQAMLLDLTDIETKLDQEPLRVTGLDAGRYELRIDDSLIGTFSVDELARGINLADYETPMFHQAQRVSWLVRDRDEAHYIHLRMRVRNANTGTATGGQDVMQAFEDSLTDSIYAEAAPKPHVYTLNLASAMPQ